MCVYVSYLFKFLTFDQTEEPYPKAKNFLGDMLGQNGIIT